MAATPNGSSRKKKNKIFQEFHYHYHFIKMGNLKIAFDFQSRRLMERYMHTCLSNVKPDGDGEAVT